MITRVHAVLFTSAPDDARVFLRDTLGFEAVDAGGGWLVFALPPAELAVHPAGTPGSPELYLMCDDIESTIEELRLKGTPVDEPVSEQRWGRLTHLAIPGGGRLGLYQPSHPTAIP